MSTVPQPLFILVLDAVNWISKGFFKSRLILENNFFPNAGETQGNYGGDELRQKPIFFYLVSSYLNQLGNGKSVFRYSGNMLTSMPSFICPTIQVSEI